MHRKSVLMKTEDESGDIHSRNLRKDNIKRKPLKDKTNYLLAMSSGRKRALRTPPSPTVSNTNNKNKNLKENKEQTGINHSNSKRSSRNKISLNAKNIAKKNSNNNRSEQILTEHSDNIIGEKSVQPIYKTRKKKTENLVKTQNNIEAVGSLTRDCFVNLIDISKNESVSESDVHSQTSRCRRPKVTERNLERRDLESKIIHNIEKKVNSHTNRCSKPKVIGRNLERTDTESKIIHNSEKAVNSHTKRCSKSKVIEKNLKGINAHSNPIHNCNTIFNHQVILKNVDVTNKVPKLVDANKKKKNNVIEEQISSKQSDNTSEQEKPNLIEENKSLYIQLTEINDIVSDSKTVHNIDEIVNNRQVNKKNVDIISKLPKQVQVNNNETSIVINEQISSKQSDQEQLNLRNGNKKLYIHATKSETQGIKTDGKTGNKNNNEKVNNIQENLKHLDIIDKLPKRVQLNKKKTNTIIEQQKPSKQSDNNFDQEKQKLIEANKKLYIKLMNCDFQKDPSVISQSVVNCESKNQGNLTETQDTCPSIKNKQNTNPKETYDLQNLNGGVSKLTGEQTNKDDPKEHQIKTTYEKCQVKPINIKFPNKGNVKLEIEKLYQTEIERKKLASTQTKKTKCYLRKNRNHPHASSSGESATEVKHFRNRLPVNYAEISMNDQPTVTNKGKSTTKVPVYKTKNSKNVEKETEDQYEFDSDSEKKKIPRKKKKTLDDSNLYDKNMKEVMSRLMTKIKKRTNKPKLKKVKFKTTDLKNNLEANALVPYDKVSTKQPECEAINKEPKTENVDNEINSCKNDLLPPLSPISRNFEGFNPIDEDCCNKPKPDSPADASNFFGFDDSLSPKSNKTDSKIIVHQNILLPSDLTIDSPTFFNKRRPNANSTMLCVPRSPWRFASGVTQRNPHFLKLKKSALPAIEQDMVLDYSYDQKLSSTTLRQMEETTKEPIQKSILNFISVKDGLINEETIPTSSLFDNDQLSPLKHRPRSSAEISPRKILGLRQDINSFSTPIRGGGSNVPRPDVSVIHSVDQNNKENEISYFGFDSNVEDSFDNLQPKKNPSALPFRFNTDRLKRYAKKPSSRMKKIIEKTEEVIENEKSTNSSNEDIAVDVKLFEDPEVAATDNEPPKCRRKRPKIMFCPSPDEVHIKKKTKKEDPAFKKWAEEMNSTFAEIDQFELEVE